MKSMIVSILFVLIALPQNLAWAGPAVAVSPGTGRAITSHNCPTFSWSMGKDASSYRIEIYEQITTEVQPYDLIQKTGKPVLVTEIAAPALSWTPSSGECLERGIDYIWYVLSFDEYGDVDWSEGRFFHVETAPLTTEQKSAVQEVVEDYFSRKSGAETESTSGLNETVDRQTAISAIASENATSTFYGNNAGQNNPTGANNTFIGAHSGYWNSSGHDNTFIGWEAGALNSGGDFNTFIGSRAGYKNLADQNTFIGAGAGFNNQTGTGNTFFGNKAGYENTTSFNTFIGHEAGMANSSGSQNVFVGAGAGYNNETGVLNTFIGPSAGVANRIGKFNIYIGYGTGGQDEAIGDNNVHIGNFAGSRLETGYNNTFFGTGAGSRWCP